MIKKWISSIHATTGKFRAQKSRQKFAIQNFPNSLLPRKFNSGCIRPIRKFIMIGQFSDLRALKSLCSYFVAYFVTFTVNVRTFSRIKVRRSTILAILAATH